MKFGQDVSPSDISTGIAEIYSSSITGSDIRYRMLATMVLLTFLLKYHFQMKVFDQQYHISPTNVKPINELYIRFKW